MKLPVQHQPMTNNPNVNPRAQETHKDAKKHSLPQNAPGVPR